MITWSTKLLTMELKAAPMITPTARSMTLPRAMNSRNSLITLMASPVTSKAGNLGPKPQRR
jgi:hypothetical protein